MYMPSERRRINSIVSGSLYPGQKSRKSDFGSVASVTHTELNGFTYLHNISDFCINKIRLQNS